MSFFKKMWVLDKADSAVKALKPKVVGLFGDPNAELGAVLNLSATVISLNLRVDSGICCAMFGVIHVPISKLRQA